MSDIFNYLNFNFDTSKLGVALDPEENLESGTKKTIPIIPKWQYDAIAGNQVSTSNYLKNPVANVTQSIRDTSNTIITLSTGNVDLTQILTAANTISGYSTGDEFSSTYIRGRCEDFLSHTNNVAGVTISTSETFPDFFTASGIGKLVFSIVSKYEGITDNRPILGSMTSLFVGPDLEGNLSQMIVATNDIRDSIRITEGETPLIESDLTEVRKAQILTLLTNVATTMQTRREQDIQFYGRCRNILDRYTTITKFSNFDALQLHLVENLVGTDILKSKL